MLVTNLGVHFKQGRDNSLVWVTSLDKGLPVEGADVAVSDCNGQPLWKGRTDARGLAIAARPLDVEPRKCNRRPRVSSSAPARPTPRARAAKAGAVDVAFTFSSWQKGIESWRFNVADRSAAGCLTSALRRCSTGRCFRAGETVSMKHFVRLETSLGLAAVPADRLPNRVSIVPLRHR